jgi:hypothetical protein
MTTIDAPGAVQTHLRGISNRGQIAIDTVDGQLRHHSFVLDKRCFAELTRRGAPTRSLATDIGHRGRIIG